MTWAYTFPSPPGPNTPPDSYAYRQWFSQVKARLDEQGRRYIDLLDVDRLADDGTTDALATFNAAQEALPAEGGTILLPVPRSTYYKSTGTWVINKHGVRLSGMSMMGSTIYFPSSTGILIGDFAGGPYDIGGGITSTVIEHLLLTGGGTGDGFKVGVAGGTNVLGYHVIRNTWAYGFTGGAGYHIANAVGVQLQNGFADSCQDGVNSDGTNCTTLNMHGMWLRKNSRNGLRVTSHSVLTATGNNVMESNHEEGAYFKYTGVNNIGHSLAGFYTENNNVGRGGSHPEIYFTGDNSGVADFRTVFINPWTNPSGSNTSLLADKQSRGIWWQGGRAANIADSIKIDSSQSAGYCRFDGVTNLDPGSVNFNGNSTNMVSSITANAGAQTHSNAQWANHLAVVDGITAPSATVGWIKVYGDVADGDLKAIFGDGTIKTILTD